jgi:hypothetical protein
VRFASRSPTPQSDAGSGLDGPSGTAGAAGHRAGDPQPLRQILGYGSGSQHPLWTPVDLILGLAKAALRRNVQGERLGDQIPTVPAFRDFPARWYNAGQNPAAVNEVKPGIPKIAGPNKFRAYYEYSRCRTVSKYFITFLCARKKFGERTMKNSQRDGGSIWPQRQEELLLGHLSFRFEFGAGL